MKPLAYTVNNIPFTVTLNTDHYHPNDITWLVSTPSSDDYDGWDDEATTAHGETYSVDMPILRGVGLDSYDGSVVSAETAVAQVAWSLGIRDFAVVRGN